MTSGKLPVSKTMKVPRKCCTKTGPNVVQNFSRKSNRSSHKAQEHHNKDEFPTERRAKLRFHPGGPGQALVSSRKIKLQLFPVSKGTRKGLEKDGHNPYLELTLSSQKKISSILKHLEKKWGSSAIAMGEPVLFPYDIMENLTNCRMWTSNDSDVTAAEVHAAVGSPAIFRLRYGWISIHEARSICVPPSSIPVDATAQFGGTLGGCNTNIETSYAEREKVEAINKVDTTFDKVDATDSVAANKIDNLSVKLQENEPITSSGMRHLPVLWDDLMNVSIGALLSEASLQGKFSNSEAKSRGSNARMQPNQIISDSLDAFITAEISHLQGSSQSTADFHTSILDAEETCHAFPLQKFSSVGKDVQALGGKAHSGVCVQDGSSNLSTLPEADEVNDQAALRHDSASGRTETELLLSSRIYDDERSLGLTGINWNDSLGPFDLGMPAKKFIGEDSLSVGGFVR